MGGRKRRARHERHPGAGSGPAPGPSGGRGRREAETRHWLYGLHAVAAALDNPARDIHRLVVTARTARALGLVAAAPPRPGLPLPEVVPAGDLAALLPRDAVHQGAALLADPLPRADLDTACRPAAGGPNLVVVLDQVTDPQNAGAVLRAAAAFGARAVVTPERRSAPPSGALAKAASGALETVPLVRVVNLARSLARLKELGYWCLGLDPAADEAIESAAPAGPVALVLGAEGRGLRRLTRERCDALARIPISGAVESLNVAAAAAVALYALAGAAPDRRS